MKTTLESCHTQNTKLVPVYIATSENSDTSLTHKKMCAEKQSDTSNNVVEGYNLRRQVRAHSGDRMATADCLLDKKNRPTHDADGEVSGRLSHDVSQECAPIGAGSYSSVFEEEMPVPSEVLPYYKSKALYKNHVYLYC